MKCKSIKIIIVAQKPRIWKGMAVAYFKLPPKNMSGGSEKKCKSHQTEQLVNQSRFKPCTP